MTGWRGLLADAGKEIGPSLLSFPGCRWVRLDIGLDGMLRHPVLPVAARACVAAEIVRQGVFLKWIPGIPAEAADGFVILVEDIASCADERQDSGFDVLVGRFQPVMDKPLLVEVELQNDTAAQELVRIGLLSCLLFLMIGSELPESQGSYRIAVREYTAQNQALHLPEAGFPDLKDMLAV